MVVCHCLALNDAAIADVASPNNPTVDAVVAACGAGSKCGGCRPLIEEVLEKALPHVEPRVVSTG